MTAYITATVIQNLTNALSFLQLRPKSQQSFHIKYNEITGGWAFPAPITHTSDAYGSK